MQDDKVIQKVAKEILLKYPKFQHANQIYQFVWFYWEYVANKGKPLSALSPEAFIYLNVQFGTVESIIRARRKVLERLDIKEISRYEQAQKHRQTYLEKS